MHVLSRLVEVAAPAHAEAVVLVLHGGASRRDMMLVSPAQLSVLRMIPTAQRIAREGRGRLAVLRLLNSYRGWDAQHTPLDDVRWAVGEVAARYGDRPVGLVGHSMGGRAALLSAGLPEVASVVALNPWLYPAERPVRSPTPVLVVHGLRDRIAPASRSAAYVQRLGRRSHAAYVAVAEGKHAMLRHGGVFDRYAAEFSAAILLPDPRDMPGPVGQVLAGERYIRV
jgi:pimeloyl-ACP methyl ester carboxylesterase